jgi:tripartite-type tricarboxylate transporter receptor subunit TctC
MCSRIAISKELGERSLRRRVIAGLMMLAACLAAPSAGADTFPSKQSTIVVPFTAGGPTDTLARILAERMSRALRQTMIVDNTTGAAGTAGVGAASHIGGLYFEEKTGTKVRFIPYRGGGPALQDLVAGQIDIMFDQAANSIPQIQAGKIKVFAVTAKQRMKAMPDVPTVDEVGLPGLYIAVWHGLWAPKGTPKDVTAKLSAAIMESLADPQVREKFIGLGQEIPEPAQQTAQSLRAYHEAEIKL